MRLPVGSMVSSSATTIGTDKVHTYILIHTIHTEHTVFLAGEDFDRNLALPNIDFATYVGVSSRIRGSSVDFRYLQHLYPQTWYVLRLAGSKLP